MVVNVFKEHKISAIQDFLSRLCLSFYKRRKITKIVLVKKLQKVLFSRHPPVPKKIFQDLTLYGD